MTMMMMKYRGPKEAFSILDSDQPGGPAKSSWFTLRPYPRI